MIRFTFTPDAEHDIDEIARYLKSLPETPALRIGREIQKAIKTITDHPAIGRVDDRLTSQSPRRILRYICGQYILFYYVEDEKARIVGIIHGNRDVDSIMRRRFE
jgi:plasmid stabilization system protein ParE